MARPVLAIHQQYVRETVAVVIDESASRTHRFGQILFPEGCIVVFEMQARLRRDVTKLNLREGRNTSCKQYYCGNQLTHLVPNSGSRILKSDVFGFGRHSSVVRQLSIFLWGTGRRSHGQLYRNVLMNRLPLVVILGMKQTVVPRDRLGRLVGLETHVPNLMLMRLLRVAQAVIAKHQVVVGLQVFGVDRQHSLKLLNRILILTLKKQNPSQVVQRHAIARILTDNQPQAVRGIFDSFRRCARPWHKRNWLEPDPA